MRQLQTPEELGQHLREQVAYQVGRLKPNPGDDEGADGFISDLCGWVDQVVEAGRDLWFTVG